MQQNNSDLDGSGSTTQERSQQIQIIWFILKW